MTKRCSQSRGWMYLKSQNVCKKKAKLITRDTKDMMRQWEDVGKVKV